MRWQARVCWVAANKYSLMAHASMLLSYVFNFGLHAIHLLLRLIKVVGEVNTGINFRYEGEVLTVHSGGILGEKHR